MNLHRMLQERAAAGRPIRVGLIGAGKFGAMFLAQVPRTPGIHLVAIADRSVERARQSLQRVGWAVEQYTAPSLSAALAAGRTHVGEDVAALIAAPGIDVMIDATGAPTAGVAHAAAAIAHRKHIVMVNVEADALGGPLLAQRAREAGVVYSLAYGDQPALIAELVDWARTSGFEATAAGKGTKYLPVYHTSTPETVWGYFGITPEQAETAGMNPQMFNSFIDGTKSAIEMAAVANATGLTPAPEGLAFPPCGMEELASVLRPVSEGGALHHRGQVEVVSSLQRNGRPVERDLRWGVYVVFAAGSDYTARCFADYGLHPDPSGRYAAMFRPYHLVGLEVGVSVASAALRGEPTGSPTGFRGDVVAIAKRDLGAGERLDGEGGYTVYGRLMPAADSLALGGLPIGLAHGVELVKGVPAGSPLRWTDVAIDERSDAVRLRREMEALFAS